MERTDRIFASLLSSLALMSPLLGRPAPAQAGGQGIPDDPRILDAIEVRERIAAGERQLGVIVSLSGTGRMRAFRAWDDPRLAEAHRGDVAAVTQLVLTLLPPSEFTLARRLENLPIFAGRITPAGLRALLASPLVESVEIDHRVTAQTDQGITLMNGDLVRSDFTGSRLSIAIVDTGIDYNHVALGNGGFPNAKVIGGRDIADNDSDPVDQNGHGTQVAGIAAGDVVVTTGDYVGGVAPGARLYALKIVQGGQDDADTSDILGAWDWCVTHQNDDPAHPILVINTSFGGGQHTSACGGSVESTAANAVSAGITVFASAGNDGYCSALSSPGCASSVIAVGAVYDGSIGSQSFCGIASTSCVAIASPACPPTSTGFICTDTTTAADQVTCYSNSASFLSLLAPSHNASTTALGGGYSATFGGTSAASPYAAGAGALILDMALASGTTFSPSLLKATMVATGDSILDTRSNITKPRVNIGHAAGTWVDFSYGGTELGTFSQPFNTVGEAEAAVATGGFVQIKTGTTSSTMTITKRLHLQSFGGTVVIGQ